MTVDICWDAREVWKARRCLVDGVDQPVGDVQLEYIVGDEWIEHVHVKQRTVDLHTSEEMQCHGSMINVDSSMQIYVTSYSSESRTNGTSSSSLGSN